MANHLIHLMETNVYLVLFVVLVVTNVTAPHYASNQILKFHSMIPIGLDCLTIWLMFETTFDERMLNPIRRCISNNVNDDHNHDEAIHDNKLAVEV